MKDPSGLLNDYAPSFYVMLSTLNEKRIHQPWKHVFLTEVYKCLNTLSRTLINEVFYLR